MDKRVRSPNYPAMSLRDAVEKIETVYRNVQQHSAPREVLAKALGYTGLNGASATALSALNKYGLLDGRGDDLRVSELALSILHPNSKEERAKAITEAALEPRLFAELNEKFRGDIPNDELLKNHLVRSGFALNAVTHVIQSYRETSEFVKQETGGYNPGVPPKENKPAMDTQDQRAQASNSNQGKTNQALEGTRVLHRFDFGDGSFVAITISRDADPQLALEAIEASLPSVKAITNLEAKRRADASQRDHENSTSTQAEKDD